MKMRTTGLIDFGRLMGVAAAFTVLGISASARASSLVTWATPQNITGPGATTVTTTPSPSAFGTGQTITNGTNDVNTSGTQVLGVNYSGSPGSTYPYDVTINTQSFLSVFGSGRTIPGYADTFANNTNGFGPVGAAAQSYGVFTQPSFIGGATDYTLQNGKFAGQTTASITVSSLKSGDQYLVQFWVSDSRSFGVSRTETISAGATDVNIPTLHYNQGTVGTDGQWVTGTFTADSSLAETLNLTASADAQVNLFQLRDVTVPEPASLGLLVCGGLTFLARRRRTSAPQKSR